MSRPAASSLSAPPVVADVAVAASGHAGNPFIRAQSWRRRRPLLARLRLRDEGEGENAAVVPPLRMDRPFFSSLTL
jgi:hypothetical protein